jgi:hypothetical protein
MKGSRAELERRLEHSLERQKELELKERQVLWPVRRWHTVRLSSRQRLLRQEERKRRVNRMRALGGCFMLGKV